MTVCKRCGAVLVLGRKECDLCGQTPAPPEEASGTPPSQIAPMDVAQQSLGTLAPGARVPFSVRSTLPPGTMNVNWEATIRWSQTTWFFFPVPGLHR